MGKLKNENQILFAFAENVQKTWKFEIGVDLRYSGVFGIEFCGFGEFEFNGIFKQLLG